MKCVFYATLSGLILLTISPVWAVDKQVIIKSEDCKILTRHVPEKGVAYTPGEDVKGRKVMPADLTPPVDLETQEYSFYLVRDVAKRSDLKQEMIVGYVALKDGQVSLNGKTLSAPDHEALVAFCRARVKDN